MSLTNSFWLKNLNLAILGSGDPYGAVQEPLNFFRYRRFISPPKELSTRFFFQITPNQIPEVGFSGIFYPDPHGSVIGIRSSGYFWYKLHHYIGCCPVVVSCESQSEFECSSSAQGSDRGRCT